MLAACQNFLLSSFILLTLLTGLTSLKIDRAEESWIWIQRCLLQAFNHTSGNQLKKWELSVTPEGFFRLRKYFLSGKQEYFSFHLSRLKDINYNGTSQWGDLIFKAIEDDIIVQTYNDPKGNIDSMATILSIPVLDMEPERLDSLRNALIVFKH